MSISKFFQTKENINIARSQSPNTIKHKCLELGRTYFNNHPELVKDLTKSIEIFPYHVSFEKAKEGIILHYFEKLLMGFHPFDKTIVWLKEKVSLDRPDTKILLTCHFGGVEFLPLTLALSGLKYAMVLRFKTVELKRSLTERANMFGVELIDADEPNSFRKLLTSKKPILLELDEFSEWVQDKPTTILNQRIYSDKTLRILEARLKQDTSLCLMIRDKDRYKLHIEHINSPIFESAWDSFSKILETYSDQWYQLSNWSKAIERLGVQ